MSRLRVLEIFSCMGGMAEGFRRAGIEFAIAVDMDPNACDSYEANLGRRPLQVNARKMLGHKETRGPWDLVVADPPCTPWSRAGKRRGLKDSRDMFRSTVGILDVLRPRCWVIGNVPGLDDSDNWEKVVKPMLGAWAWRVGYCVDYGRFNCADYGVPQIRRRPFWFGHPKGAACIRWPAPTHAKPNGTLRIDGMPPWATCRDALGHLPLDEVGRPVMLMADPRHNSHEDRPANVVTTREARREHVLLLNQKHPICEPGAPARTVCVRDRGGQSSSGIAWPWDRPATTIMADSRIPPAGLHGDSYMSEGIVLSEKARLILQGFPEGWIVCGKTKKARDSQIGQAMPPPMAMRVAESIVEWFGRYIVRRP